MQVEIINNNTILKIWYWKARVHLPVQFAIHTILLAPDTDLSRLAISLANYIQLIDS